MAEQEPRRAMVYLLTSLWFLSMATMVKGKGSTQCPSGWRPSLPSAHDTNGNCYVRMPTAKNFTAAEDNCRVQGGHLASIASDNENNIVRNLSNTQIWIGLNDIDEETTFVWTDSSSYNYTMWDRYKFGMEPNNVGNGIKGPANCVRMMPSGKWRDTHCSDKLAYVCEISAQTATTQAPMTAGEMSHSSKTPAAFTVNSIRISCTNLPQINESCKNAKHATHPATLAPTPNSTANVSESKRRSDSESSAAAVGGGVAAACIAIAIVCVLVVLVLYRRRKVHTNGQSEGPGGERFQSTVQLDSNCSYDCVAPNSAKMLQENSSYGITTTS